MGGPVDLHSHTTASDGTLTPRELVREAVRRGVRVLAITDHDSTDGLGEALDEAASHPILTIVPGLEINCDVPGSEVHVLGYFPAEVVPADTSWASASFQQFLAEQREERVKRVHRMAERLGELGMPIEPAEVFALVKEGSPGRPHVAQVMVKHGYVKSVREAFDKFLNANGPANVPRKRLTPADAVTVIRRARGVPVFAHPAVADRDELIPGLVAAGLAGIEVFYPEHGPNEVGRYLDLCRTHDLIATGGSDYHGPQSGKANVPGQPPVKLKVWNALRERAARIAG